MFKNTLIIILLTLTTMLSAKPLSDSIKAIYGEDGRLDLYDVNDIEIFNMAKSTAAMMTRYDLEESDENYRILGNTLSERVYLCEGERFGEQYTAAACSGFLVAPNLLVTAGHCIKDLKECKNKLWVFDFNLELADSNYNVVPKKSVYRCKNLIERSLDGISKDDYALIELDREVTDRMPLKYRRTGKITVDTELVVIGHPTGLPTKVADGASVRSSNAEKYFVANLDTFKGNSGSAVINASKKIVEGILVRGEQDYIYDNIRQCHKLKYCENGGCRGEDVTRITNISFLRDM